MKKALPIVIILLLQYFLPLNATTVNDLRVEYMKNPIGIDVNQPRFSWKPESDERGVFQTAYRIIVSADESFKKKVWDSGEVASDQSVAIVYGGAALSPTTRYFWKVQVKDQTSRTIVSTEKAFFETGLMNLGWSNAQWIKSSQRDTINTVPMFRTTCTLNKKIRSARIYASGLGIYEVYINGKRVGTTIEKGKTVYDEFKPGWTDYTRTVSYSTYDVKDLLIKGKNAIGAIVAPGWWQGGISHGKYGNPDLGFIAKLVVNYTDGTSEVVVTNSQTWKCSSDGAIRQGDIYNGEIYDARKEIAWTSPGFDDSNWQACGINTDFKGEIKAFVGPTVQVRTQLQRIPVKITRYEGVVKTDSDYGKINVKETYTQPAVISLPKGQTLVYDMGQNMTGWVKFKVKGAAGTEITMRFAEMLNDEGKKSRGDDGPGGSLYRINLRSAKAMLQYTLKGDAQGEEYHPSTTFFGFRYCDLTTTEDIEIESLTGEVVGTASEEVGSFSTDHPEVNQLFSNIIWGQRSNFLSIPTDCPQRDERLGWMGDIQIFGRTASYNADLDAFFRKWTGDVRDSQRDDGAYPDVAPHCWVGYGQAAWAEAGIIIPWTAYLMYADKDILIENYPAMEKYMAFLAAQADDKYKYNGAGTNYGDWVSYVKTDSRYISVCYYAYSALLMEKISLALSSSKNDLYAQKAAYNRILYNNIKREFQTRYIDAAGRLTQNTQTAYLLALKLDLFPTAITRQRAINNLQILIMTNGNKLNTGFVGTGTIMPTLSDVGLTDVAYDLLLQRENPSWLYSVDQGATTVWERWNSYTKENGFNPNIGMNSFNHYAYGAVAEWMYRYVAGINPDENNPGFKHILLNPSPDFRKSFPEGQTQIKHAEASYDSYYGTIKSAWKIEDNGDVRYDVTIPANTTATLTLLLPGKQSEIFESELSAENSKGVVSVTKKDDTAIIELASGSYSFRTSVRNPV